jgi:hypothetical protein
VDFSIAVLSGKRSIYRSASGCLPLATGGRQDVDVFLSIASLKFGVNDSGLYGGTVARSLSPVAESQMQAAGGQQSVTLALE